VKLIKMVNAKATCKSC